MQEITTLARVMTRDLRVCRDNVIPPTAVFSLR